MRRLPASMKGANLMKVLACVLALGLAIPLHAEEPAGAAKPADVPLPDAYHVGYQPGSGGANPPGANPPPPPAPPAPPASAAPPRAPGAGGAPGGGPAPPPAGAPGSARTGAAAGKRWIVCAPAGPPRRAGRGRGADRHRRDAASAVA